jgi:hypothetical protein
LNNEEAKKNDRPKLLPIGLPTLPLLKPIYTISLWSFKLLQWTTCVKMNQHPPMHHEWTLTKLVIGFTLPTHYVSNKSYIHVHRKINDYEQVDGLYISKGF